jgi:hypothetical protein
MSPVISQASAVYAGSQKIDRAYVGSVKVYEGIWTPASVTGLKIWFDASQLGLADGAAVAPWPNLAVGGVPGTIFGTPAPKIHANALNAKPVVRFTTQEGRMRMTGTGMDKAFTLGYVARMLPSQNVGRIVGGIYPPPNFLLGWWNGQEDVAYSTSGGFFKPSVAILPSGNWVLYSADADAPPSYFPRLFRNGVLLSTGGSDGSAVDADSFTGTFSISGYDPTSTTETVDCEIAEVVLYDHMLSDTERQTVEKYLRDKWLPLPPVPKQIPGLLWWIDPSNLPGASGSPVSSLSDLSDKNYNATAMEDAPILRKNASGTNSAVTFSGSQTSSTRMLISGLGTEMSGRSNYSVVLAVRPKTFDGYPVMLSSPRDSLWLWMVEYDASTGVYFGVGNGCFRLFNANAQPNIWKTLVLTQSGSTQRFWHGGIEITTYSVGPSGDSQAVIPNLGSDVLLGGYIGDNFGLDGDLGEIMIYDHALTDIERQTLESYLRTKWAT